MGEVELDWSTAARFEVHEQQALVGAQQVAGVRLAVQQLLADTAGQDRAAQTFQRVDEKRPVGVG